MKAILEFNLPDEDNAYWCAVKGRDMFRMIFKLREELRQRYKYMDNLSDDARDELENTRKCISELLEEYGLNELY